MSTPEELRYTEEHEWVGTRENGSLRVGITDYAQEQLGDVVFVDLPKVGTEVNAGDPFGEIESTKSVSELFAPVAGTVVGVNQAVADAPELVNSEPYESGWLIELEPADTDDVTGLLDADDYRAIIEG